MREREGVGGRGREWEETQAPSVIVHVPPCLHILYLYIAPYFILYAITREHCEANVSKLHLSYSEHRAMHGGTTQQ